MSILSKEEFLNTLKNRIGESNTDEDIKFLEDMTDTYEDLAKAKGNSDNENWKEKYEQLDKDWKEKYKQRFFDTSTKDEEVKEQENSKEEITIDDLFTSKGE